MASIRVRNWERFQHYRYRDPTFIKLYIGLPDDPDWGGLSDKAGKYLPAIWCQAARFGAGGLLPDVGRLAWQLRLDQDSCQRILDELNGDFLEEVSDVVASELLAERYQSASKMLIQSRVEKSTEKSRVREEEPHPQLSADATDAPTPSNPQWTIEDCRAAAAGLAMPDEWVVAFDSHYGQQGWRRGNGQPITDLKRALAKWKADQESRAAEAAAGRAAAEQDPDPGVRDYAVQLREAWASKDDSRIESLRRKARDTYGKGGWARVTAQARSTPRPPTPDALQGRLGAENAK